MSEIDIRGSVFVWRGQSSVFCLLSLHEFNHHTANSVIVIIVLLNPHTRLTNLIPYVPFSCILSPLMLRPGAK